MDDDEDPHAPMRGLINGCLYGAGLWVIIITVTVKACEVLR